MTNTLKLEAFYKAYDASYQVFLENWQVNRQVDIKHSTVQKSSVSNIKPPSVNPNSACRDYSVYFSRLSLLDWDLQSQTG